MEYTRIIEDWFEAGLEDVSHRPITSTEVMHPFGETPEWDVLRASVQECQRCSFHQTRRQAIVGEGDPTSQLMCVLDAPGSLEDETGQVLGGATGELFTKMIQAMGLSREKIYTTYVVKCAPSVGSGVSEMSSSATQCQAFSEAEIQWMKPQIIVVFGATACATFLKESFEKTLGQWRTYRSHRVMVTHHPSALLRHPELKKTSWAHLQEVMRALTAPA